MLKWRALTLLETMLAMGVLLTGLVGILSLFQSGLQYSRRTEQQLQLTYTGREMLRQRLASLQDGAAFRALTPGVGPWQASSDLEYRWIVTQQALYSPGESLEQAFVATNQKVLRDSARRLELQLRQGATSTSLLATAGEPLRSWAIAQPLLLQSSSSLPIAKGGTMDFTVRCQGDGGRDLSDVTVSWSVLPVDGVGTLEGVSRDGSRATLRHKTRRKNGTPKFQPGTCYVLAQASYAGQRREVRSALITLAGP